MAAITAKPIDAEPPDFAPIIAALGERLGMAPDGRVDEARTAAAAAGVLVVAVLVLKVSAP